MRFFCCGDENDAAVGRGAVIRRETFAFIVEVWQRADNFDFKNIDARIEHSGQWTRAGDDASNIYEAIVSVPTSCAKEIIAKLRTTPDTGITAVRDVKTDFGIFELEQRLKTAKYIKEQYDKAHQNTAATNPLSRSM